MGIYDIYGETQIKAGFPEGKRYCEGDEVPLPDGAYIGYEGVVVVKDGKFVVELDFVAGMDTIYDKWGGAISAEDLINQRSPVVKAMKKAEREIVGTALHVWNKEDVPS